MNWYTYCNDNPVMLVDPVGLAATAYFPGDPRLNGGKSNSGAAYAPTITGNSAPTGGGGGGQSSSGKNSSGQQVGTNYAGSGGSSSGRSTKSISSNSGGRIGGYPAIYGSRKSLPGTYIEKYKPDLPGAFISPVPPAPRPAPRGSSTPIISAGGSGGYSATKAIIRPKTLTTIPEKLWASVGAFFSSGYIYAGAGLGYGYKVKALGAETSALAKYDLIGTRQENGTFTKTVEAEATAGLNIWRLNGTAGGYSERNYEWEDIRPLEALGWAYEFANSGEWKDTIGTETKYAFGAGLYSGVGATAEVGFNYSKFISKLDQIW